MQNWGSTFLIFGLHAFSFGLHILVGMDSTLILNYEALRISNFIQSVSGLTVFTLVAKIAEFDKLDSKLKPHSHTARRRAAPFLALTFVDVRGRTAVRPRTSTYVDAPSTYVDARRRTSTHSSTHSCASLYMLIYANYWPMHVAQQDG